MRTFKQYIGINEWKASSKNTVSIANYDSFLYKVNLKDRIRVFNDQWKELKDHRNDVFINGKRVEVNEYGWTTEYYEVGVYEVLINISKVTDCENMFKSCHHLYIVPYLNTINVKNMSFMFSFCTELVKVEGMETKNVVSMERMFRSCHHLETVPLFNIDNCKYLDNMFYDCPSLSFKSKKEWKKIYDFDEHIKK